MPILWDRLCEMANVQKKDESAEATTPTGSTMPPTGFSTGLVYVQPKTTGVIVYGNLAVYIGLVIWGVTFILTDYREVDTGFTEISSSLGINAKKCRFLWWAERPRPAK